MNPLVFTIAAVIVIPILTATNKHKFLFVLALCGLFTECFFIEILEYRFFISSYIGIFYFIFNFKSFFNNATPLGKFYWYDLLSVSLVGAYFVYISPWMILFESFRTPTQRLPLRTLVGVIRTVEPIIGFFYFLDITRRGKISFVFFVKTICTIILTTFIVGTIDWLFTQGAIRVFTISGFRSGLSSRFTGLSGEPRVVGYAASITLLILFPLLKKYSNDLKLKKLINYSIFACFFCVTFSFSTTAIVHTSICFLFYVLLGKVKFTNLVVAILVSFTSFYVLSYNEEFLEHQQERFNQVNLSEKTTTVDNAPNFINSFEQFDQVALAFFYFNPQYLLFGVGPNTINIPANVYNPKNAEMFVVDSAPSNGITYTVSRIGILGFFIMLVSFFFTFKKIKSYNDPFITDSLLLLMLQRLIIYYYPYFPWITAIFLGTLMYESKMKQKIKNALANSQTEEIPKPL